MKYIHLFQLIYNFDLKIYIFTERILKCNCSTNIQLETNRQSGSKLHAVRQNILVYM